VALKAVVFDVGETLVDEERWWRELAARTGMQPHVVWAALGVTIERGEEHDALWGHLGVEKPSAAWYRLMYERADLYPDAIACLEAVRALELKVGVAGNQTEQLEAWAKSAGLPADVIASSESLGVRKPQLEFFERIVELMGFAAGEVAYVGDRVDNDVLPAASAGLVAVHVRRGPWGRLQATPPEAALGVDDLTSLPDALASLG
jgi:FMN phosphatase YigB (HAD superfamily)